MVVLVAGATGFLGASIARALAQAGHDVRAGMRPAPGMPPGAVAIDYTRDHHVADWLPRLRGVDVVVNAVGILRERAPNTFAALHRDAPRALFDACVRSGVRQIVQISALGADAEAASGYHASKRDADRHLATLTVPSVIVQPSLVYGPAGASARLFESLATLPVFALPDGGRQLVQPVHVDDLLAAIVALVGRDTPPATTIAIVGPQALTLTEYLQRLRVALGKRRARVIALPMPLVRFAASVAARVPGALLDRETLAMLERGNTADATPLARLLGRMPRPVDAFIAPPLADATRARAVLAWQLPLLRLSIAVVWIWTGVVSFGVYPVAESYALLARLGLTGTLATMALYGAAALDVALGVATLAIRRRRWLWRAQIALIASYTVLISVWLPEFWLHPYGPLTKNLPMIAAIWLMATLERDAEASWTT